MTETGSLNVLFCRKQHEIKLDLQVIVQMQTSQTCSGKNSVQDSDCLRELLVDNRSKDCVFKCVSYLHTLVLFMYFYNFTVKICLKCMFFYIKYLLIQSGKVRDVCFDFLH